MALKELGQKAAEEVANVFKKVDEMIFGDESQLPDQEGTDRVEIKWDGQDVNASDQKSSQ